MLYEGKHRFIVVLVVLWLLPTGMSRVWAKDSPENVPDLSVGLEREVITHYEPVVLYGERILPEPALPWHKRPWVWILIAGIVGGGIWAAEDEGSSVPPGALLVTAPAP